MAFILGIVPYNRPIYWADSNSNYFLNQPNKLGGYEEHALYISVIQIQKAPHQNTAKINIKVFTDDLQSALRNEFSDYKPVKVHYLL